jgi:hypothetical protein
MTLILVGIKLSEGLAEDITISVKGTSIKQTLDYEGILLKCGNFHMGISLRIAMNGTKYFNWIKWSLVVKFLPTSTP